MTRLLLAFLDAARSFGPLIVVNIAEHVGSITYNGASDDEDEQCDCDPDTAHPTYVLMPVPDAADLFAEVGRRCRNGADPEDEGWTMARSLELGGEVA